MIYLKISRALRAKLNAEPVKKKKKSEFREDKNGNLMRQARRISGGNDK